MSCKRPRLFPLLIGAALLLVGPAVPASTVSGTLTSKSGAAIVDGYVITIDAAGAVVGRQAVSGDDGGYTIDLPAGSYTLVPDSQDAAVKPVTVKDGEDMTVDFSGDPLPAISLDPADAPAGTQWRFNALESTIWDFSPADPHYKEVGTWTTPDLPSDAGCQNSPELNGQGGNGCFYWYVVRFTVPAEWKNASRSIIVDRYGVEDNDWAWINGVPIGFDTAYPGSGQERRYQVPNDAVVYGGENVLAIKGNHGRGGAGMHDAGRLPRIRQGNRAAGRVIVYLRDKSRTSPASPVITYTPAMNVPVTLSNAKGEPVKTLLTDQAGYSWFQDLDPGTYTVQIDGSIGLKSVSPASQTVTVEALRSADVEPAIELIDVAPGGADPRDDDFSGTALDMKWTSKEWGGPGGGIDVKDGVLTLSGGGEFGGTDDSGRFLYQKASGDFVAAVRVLLSEQPENGGNGRSKAALMVRADDSSSAVNALVHQAPFHRGVFFQWRPEAGGDTMAGGPGESYYETGANAPSWVVLRRVGQNVAGFVSYDGQKASLIWQADLSNLPKDLLVGPAWASQGDVTRSQFSSFRLRDLTTSTPLEGDLNSDGKVDIKDATLSLQIAVGSVNPTDPQKGAGDLNHDGKLDLKDTTLILKKAVGL